jgi:hypothetical protein
MIQPGSELDLSQKSVWAKRSREIRMKNLERNYAIVLRVLREIHCRHSTASELPVNRIRL